MNIPRIWLRSVSYKYFPASLATGLLPTTNSADSGRKENLEDRADIISSARVAKYFNNSLFHELNMLYSKCVDA